MVFSSLTFLFFFLPAVVILHAVLPVRWRNGFLLLASVVFYCFGDAKYLPLLTALTVLNWALGLALGRWTGGRRRALMWTAVAINVLSLGYYKYVGMLPFVTNPPALPLGISFYIFQSLSYLLDVYAGRVPSEKSLPDYATYIMLFPQLIAGPIVRYSEVNAELHQRSLKAESLESGMYTFLIGLGSKVLIGNALGMAHQTLLALPDRGFLGTMVMLWAFGVQYYFDFSGYSLMAIGIGRMLGFEFPENFRHPFVSTSIKACWSRWHITLGSWMRTYVYFPLGGSRCSAGRHTFNLLVTWFLVGLWHGAGLNFICWGLFFGVIIVLETRLYGGWLQKHPRTGWVYTMLMLQISYIILSSETAELFTSTMTQLLNPGIGDNVLFTIVSYLPVLLCAALLCSQKLCERLGALLKRPALRTAAMLLVLALSVMSLLRSSYNPFLYFRF